jgi:hypothetical protein
MKERRRKFLEEWALPKNCYYKRHKQTQKSGTFPMYGESKNGRRDGLATLGGFIEVVLYIFMLHAK